MRDLTPDTLCIFSPDPSEQPDARWSAVGNDEDMEANMLYAVATPGILKLWPWVNQVCRCLQHPSTFLSQTRIRRLSRSLPSYLSRLSCSSSKEWGMYTTFTSQRVLFLFLTLGSHSHLFSSPRVILVEDFGMLVGLTTVKDVLHLEPHEQLNSPIIAWSNRGALDGALEELWTWLADMRSSVNAWYSRISRRWR
jgi:chloride channel 3/4/5